MSTDVVKAEDLAWWMVKLTHPNLHNKVAFRSVSETRARNFIQNRYPRGSEAYLVGPDGQEEHYEAERQGVMGMDAPLWGPFDHTTWIPTDTQAPPGENAWSDKEG